LRRKSKYGIFFTEDISQQVVEHPPAAHSSIVTASSEVFDWQAAFGFKSEILTNGKN
jgi:hypothetical protein